MKGVRIIHGETEKKRFVQIDIDHLDKHHEQVEYLLDAIIAKTE